MEEELGVPTWSEVIFKRALLIIRICVINDFPDWVLWKAVMIELFTNH